MSRSATSAFGVSPRFGDPCHNPGLRKDTCAVSMLEWNIDTSCRTPEQLPRMAWLVFKDKNYCYGDRVIQMEVPIVRLRC